jgi:hypothetical protein
MLPDREALGWQFSDAMASSVTVAVSSRFLYEILIPSRLILHVATFGRPTEAAICGLFEVSHQVDVIALKVLNQISETVIISGTVSRLAAAARDENLSIGMRLMYLGLTYHSAGSLFEPLGDDRYAPAAHDDGSPAFRPEESLVNTMCRGNLDLP